MLKLGQVFKDNDPRMAGRRVVITGTSADGRVVYRDCGRDGRALEGGFAFKGQARRFHFDGKPRSTGFSLVE
jgi:hypothetical protein